MDDSPLRLRAHRSRYSSLAAGGALALVLCLLGAVSGCGGAGTAEKADLSGRTIKVVTTTGMIQDLAANIGGSRVRTEALMGPGIDPHLYKASEGDVRRLSEADVIFYNGLHLEAKMAEVLERMKRGARTVAVAEAIPVDRLLRPPEFEGAFDPHVWFDVELWMMCAGRVTETLAEMDPTHRTTYEENARGYLAALDDLHAYVTERVLELPAAKRVLITAHDAFNYFGRAYGMQVRGLQGISTVSEAGTGDVQDLTAFIAEHEIPALFVESSVPPRAIEAVQAAVRSRGFEVVIGGELFSDAMGNPGTDAGTYLGMVRHNVDTVVDGLATGTRTGER